MLNRTRGSVEVGRLGYSSTVEVAHHELVPLIDQLEAIAKEYRLRPEYAQMVETTNTTAPRMPMLEELAKSGQVPTVGIPSHPKDETAS